jgi:poly(hydroxyalkanoate) depolymerase family esterase
MDNGFPRRLGRLTHRLLYPNRNVRRVLRRAATLLEPAIPPGGPAAHAAGRLSEVTGFGSNPGGLRMLLYVPPRPPRPGTSLLVLLHGCGQDAAGFGAGAGFFALADRIGAPVLLPDQQEANNHRRCFNWFRPSHTRRDSGEAASVRQMVAEALRRFAADPRRVFIAGLSAGGAMTAALLAAYPDVFAAGAVVAGLPVGSASNASEALRQMSHPLEAPRADWVARVPVQAGVRWPRLSVWHGMADSVVNPANADALVAQWTGLLGLPETPDGEAHPAPHIRHRIWGDAVEQWSIAGLGHAFPIARPSMADPYVLPAGIDAAAAIARFWGIARA